MEEYIIILKHTKYNNEFDRFLKCHHIKFEYLNDTQVYIITTSPECIKLVRSFPYIKDIAIDGYIPLDDEIPIIPVDNSDDPDDDPGDDWNWGLYRIKAPEFWKLGYTGQGVNVAIIDTGVDLHPGLSIKERKNFSDYGYGLGDVKGHGTSVAGIIGGIPEKSKVTGVAYDCNLYSLKVGDYVEDEAVIKALEWCIDNNIHVINMSFGYYPDKPRDKHMIPILHQVVEKVAKKGIIMVASSGNENRETTVKAPGLFKQVISVGAVDKNDKRWVYTEKIGSTYGPGLNFVAPGDVIYSTYKSDLYGICSGTSFAAPYVTGIITLWLSQNPSLTFEQIYDRLVKLAIPLPKDGEQDLTQYGHGLVQAIK